MGGQPNWPGIKSIPGKDYEEPGIETEDIREYRCPACRRLLFKGKLASGTVIEIMCDGLSHDRKQRKRECGSPLNRIAVL